MPSIALRLAVVACVLLAGCAAPSPGETRECPTPTEYDPKPLPGKPSDVTASSAASFAAAYEETLAWNDAVGRAETSLTSNGHGEVVRETGTGYVVHVDGGASYRTCTSGSVAVADNVFHANYFVNETVVVRLDSPTNTTVDPRTNGGEVVERWGN